MKHADAMRPALLGLVLAVGSAANLIRLDSLGLEVAGMLVVPLGGDGRGVYKQLRWLSRRLSL